MLYGREAVLEELLPRLTGLEPGGPGRRARLVRQEHPGRLPVVLLSGRHGTGKTAVLDAAQERFTGGLPLARVDCVDCGAPEGAGAPGTAPGPPVPVPLDPPSNTSGVIEVLERLVTGLARQTPGYRLRFPRLLAGLFAVSSWRRGQEGQRELAAARFERLLPLAQGAPEEDGEGWTARISAQLAGAAAEQDVEPVAGLVVGEYFARHLSGRERETVVSWYRAGAAAPGEHPGDPLVRMCLDFHQGGDLRAPVESTLLAALLDDLAEHWSGWWRRVNRRPRPLALLDDAHAPAGREFLARLLDHRARGGARTPDPLVVVAGHLDGGGSADAVYPHAVTARLSGNGPTGGWRPPPPEREPTGGVLKVPLAALAPADIQAMLRRTPRPVHPRLPTVLHRLTGGHPHGSALLCEAVVAASAVRDVDPGELLDLETEDGGPVGELLVQRLVPELPLRYHLMMLCLARDRTAAEALAASVVLAPDAATTAGGGGPGGSERTRVAEAARYLERERWAPRPAPDGPDGFGSPDGLGGSTGAGGHDGREGRDGGEDAAGGPGPVAVPSFVSHPFLHALLVHEARRGSPQVEPGRRWDDMHAFLAAHHAARAGTAGDGDGRDGRDGGGGAAGAAADAEEAEELRHTLARGRAAAVVTRLTSRFTGGGDAARWLAVLRRVATAPHPPHDAWRDERARIARGLRERTDPRPDPDDGRDGRDDQGAPGGRDGRDADVWRSVDRLLHALWLLDDPLRAPTEELCAALRKELDFLAPRHPEGFTVLDAAAGSWPAAAWAQSRPYPVYGLD
ncbi:ATP-binding protein [Streptomyces sp. NRRL F-5053]|uniref:ATP-binding protein n=1 Tax=Streptomyces sp. NRRL F-5053 TaxID=1463854 RepID=UPI000567181D|nr:ATP-binding protein [Streptomyces sp. NRRL F-5053]